MATLQHASSASLQVAFRGVLTMSCDASTYDAVGGEERHLNHLFDDWLASRGLPGSGLPEVQLLQLLGLVHTMDSPHVQCHLPHRQSLLQPHDIRACRM